MGKFCTILKRIRSSEYVQRNWEHLPVIHPGDNASDAAAYAAQKELVPKHRSDIKWLPQEVAATWKRINVTEGKPTPSSWMKENC